MRFALFLLLLSPALLAQSPRTPRVSAELGGWAATGQRTPFWLRANQWGRVPLETPAATGRLAVTLDYRPADTTRGFSRKKHPFDWGFGAEGVVNAQPGGARGLLPQAYAKVRFRGLELWAGRRYEFFTLGDSALTTGAYAWSGNGLPVPKVQLGLPDYVPLGFLKNFVALRGFYAHGWFNAPYIQGAYLHQKALYGRFGRPEGRLNVQLGLNHQVLWGGRADYLRSSTLAVNGQLPHALTDYLRGVVLGKIPPVFRNDRFTNFDGENRIGNHLGSLDFALEVRLNRGRLLAYHQHPYEDMTGLLLRNAPDGLYGLRWRPARPTGNVFALNAVLVEWLYTKFQAGSTFDLPGSRFKGGDNYFNHSQYVQGWSYFGRALGTPFLSLQTDLRPELQRGPFFANNRVAVYHVGLEGRVKNRGLLLTKLSYSRNFGTYSQPFEGEIRQFSGLLRLEWPVGWLGGTTLAAHLAHDGGGLLPSSTGTYLSLRKSWP